MLVFFQWWRNEAFDLMRELGDTDIAHWNISVVRGKFFFCSPVYPKCQIYDKHSVNIYGMNESLEKWVERTMLLFTCN